MIVDPRRVLLLMSTATYRAGAFLEAARRLGLAVTVGSERRQSLAGANPGGHLVLDFRDPPGAASRIVERAARRPLAAIVAADDDGVTIAARAAGRLGLPHHPVEAVEACRSKLETRRRLAAGRWPQPRHWSSDDPRDAAALADRVDYPCVIKPLSLSASRGVIRVDSAGRFAAALERVRRVVEAAGPEVAGRGVLVERYVPGAEFAVEGLVTAGRLRVLAIYDKPEPLEGPFFEESIYVTPSRAVPDVQRDLEAATADAVRRLGLTHGPVHAELRHNDEGPWLIEIAPRSIGGLCSRTLRFGEGDSLEMLLLRHALGQDVTDLRREPGAAGVMMVPIPRAGTLREVAGTGAAAKVEGIEGVRITVPPGQRVAPPPEGDRYLGFLFARTDRPETAEAALSEAHDRLRILID